VPSKARSDADRVVPARPVLRADAELNRRRLVAAALDVFAERGLDVPMEDVARHAGVGVATLYRRFPTRADLITGAFAVKMSAYADAVAAAVADPDPWAGFCGYLERVCGLQAGDRGFATVLTMTFPTDPAFEAVRVRAYNSYLELIARAKLAGKLREDYAAQDLVMLLLANAGLVAATWDAAPDLWRRFVAYMIQAFSAPGAGPLPRPPLRARGRRPVFTTGRSGRHPDEAGCARGSQ
jgi:AcrR family transcriptional regulator